ncbi:MAG: hypothetical protein JWP11_3695 [Frankiales bacterium]|nr:hypothetical protein [Frankiales bacterium]
MALSKRLRYEVLRRDRHTCRYCGAAAPDTTLSVDHVIPTALGGTDDPTNLVTACADCNNGKSASSPDAPIVADIAADALRWAAAMRRAADIAGRNRELLEQDRRLVDHEWNRWTSPHNAQPFARPDDWPLTVDQFCTIGLDVLDVINAVRDTMLRRGINDRWAYVCGTLWRELERRQQTARDLLTIEGDGTRAQPTAGVH